MANNGRKRKIGWPKLWVVCYEAMNGKLYPADDKLYPLKSSALTMAKYYRFQQPDNSYFILRYEVQR